MREHIDSGTVMLRVVVRQLVSMNSRLTAEREACYCPLLWVPVTPVPPHQVHQISGRPRHLPTVRQVERRARAEAHVGVAIPDLVRAHITAGNHALHRD